MILKSLLKSLGRFHLVCARRTVFGRDHLVESKRRAGGGRRRLERNRLGCFLE